MSLIAVSSSNLAAIGYDNRRGVLVVAFHSGGLYQYTSVPACEFHGLLSAESHGEYFHKRIRNRYPCRRLQ
jgi:hypothetical protein